MSHRLLTVLCCGTLALGAAACGGDRPTADAVPEDAIKVTGCLRSGDQAGTYVLTAEAEPLASVTSRATAGTMPTYVYQLVGGDNLAGHVGQQVEITGAIEAEDEVEIESSTEAEYPETTTMGGDEVTPTVEAEEEIEVELRRMQVLALRALGAACDVN